MDCFNNKLEDLGLRYHNLLMKNKTSPKDQSSSSLIKPFVEYGPIAVFFAVYWLYDLFAATAAIMITTCGAILLSYIVEQRVPIISLVTAMIVGVFGGLTLWLQDETFIKMKPTIIQVIFGITLLIGQSLNKFFLKTLMGKNWQMELEGWKILTKRFAIFFFTMAIFNEVIWRTQTTDFWVNFKVFGITTLTIVFFLTQIPLLQKYNSNLES